MAAALAIGAIRPPDVAAHIEAMTVLLAIVPSLIIPLLWRGEHALVTFMFAGLRRTAVVVVAAGFCAVAVLIGGLRGSALSVAWAVCFGVALLGVVVAARANFQRRGPPRAQPVSGR